MIKGDRIRLIKKMGVFSNIGEICEITNILDDGTICFRFGFHLGCMSYSEFEKYFELVETPKKTEFSKWDKYVFHMHTLNDEFRKIESMYRTNGKTVEVKCKGLKAKATCNDCAQFDLKKGLELAKYRLIIKLVKRELDDMIEKM